MKKIVLLFVAAMCSLLSMAQNIEASQAKALVAKNILETGISEAALASMTVSDAYYLESNQTKMVYLLQTYKGLPVHNRLLVLAFKNDKLVSKAGELISNIESLTNNASARPSLNAATAIDRAFADVHIVSPSKTPALRITENGRKLNFGVLRGVSENVTTELVWAPSEDYKTVKLAWQVQVVPVGKSDWWLIQVDAITGNILHKINLTVYEGHNHQTEKLGAHYRQATKNYFLQTQRGLSSPPPPPTVTAATYRVVPMPVESPKHGAIAVVAQPWLNAGAGNNAVTNGWHFDGTTNYDITRGNNVFAYLDVNAANAPSAASNWPDTSTTANPSLSFNFAPDANAQPGVTINKKFAVANLFYWNNLIHDVTYQYGFTEVTGNFQTDNLGRGGNGNDYVQAEAQDGGGTNNANFSTPADGGRPRMQMYLWDAVPTCHVNTPLAISGDYNAVESSFSPANKLANVGPVTGQVVWYNDDATGTLHEACGAAPVNSVTGKIALIVRGNCNFTIKVKNAQLAGAIAAIVVNNVAGDPITMGGGPDATIIIPAVMISQADGVLFANNITNNLNVTLSGGVGLDGDVDNGIVVHEYGHGISNRLTGGPSASGCLGNAEQGGEGWSDYYALMMTTNWSTALVTNGPLKRTVGTYAIGQFPTGAGIRIYPYSTDITLNPLTYASLGVAPVGTEVHNVGEVWCMALWEMTWSIIQQQNSITANLYDATGTGGNVIAMRLVTEGMRLQPCSPGFIDARNAILTADMNLYGGSHQCSIWAAFAKRGMGFSALQGSAFSATDQTPASDLPPGPTITTQPVASSVCTGATATFTTTATGSGLTYQWQVSTNGGVTWTNLSPAVTTPTLTITNVTAAMNGYQYRVVINGGCVAPTTVTSTAVALTIASSTPTITSQPANTSACTGSNATFSVVASGVGLTYSWQVSTDGGLNWATITPAVTSSTLTLTGVTAAMNNYQYRAVVTGNCGSPVSVNTNGGILTVTTGGVTINTQPANSANCSGTTATFSVNASGSNLTYVWQVSIDGGVTWNPVSPAVTTATLTLTNVTSAMNNNQYRAVINSTGTCTGTATSAAATLTVNTAPAITAQPVNSVICTGANTSFCVTATGSNLTYQWQVSTSGCAGTFTNIVGATANCYNVTGALVTQNGYGYRVVINGTCPSQLTSNCVTLNVNSAAVITGQPANSTVCPGASATFTVAASGTGNTYQWQVSSNGGTSYSNITGATSSTYTVTGVSAGMNNNLYRAVVFSCGPVGVNSNPATLTVSTPGIITTQPANVAVCASGNATFTVSGTALTSYQWQVSTNGGSTWTNITGATAPSYTITGVTIAMNGNQYRVVVAGTCVTGLNSNAATLTLNTPVAISSQPVNTQACVGSSAKISVAATGTTITYQWQESVNGGAWFNITNGGTYSGTNTNTLTISPVNAGLNGHSYRVIVSGPPCGAVTSNEAILTVNADPVVVLTAASYAAITPYTRAGLYVTVSPPGNYTYKWYKNGSLDATRTGSFFNANVDDFGQYYVIATNAATGCSGQSNMVTLKDSASKELFIYPNPGTGLFTVRYFSNISTIVRKLNVYDSKGALVYTNSFNINNPYEKMEVDLRRAASGIYMVELKDSKGVTIATSRVRIQR
ncbi:MAG: M36 family metallopeptidase [Ferruginibacter sp.]